MKLFRSGDSGYEAARRATVVNERRPPGRPEVIVPAQSEDDVLAAVSLAQERGWEIATASGGHSFSGNQLREGGLLLDLAALDDTTIDTDARRATAGPGLQGSKLAAELTPLGLFFPVGHCPGPALGGFLLKGGFGWNSRALGPACTSVCAIDVVTAQGESLRADADHHPELFWAARGAGPGFPAVVTRFHLELHERPQAQLLSMYIFPLELLDELMGWAHAVAPAVPATVEMMVIMTRDLPGVPGPGLQLVAPVLAGSEEQAIADLAIIEECPLIDRAAMALPRMAMDVTEMSTKVSDLYPSGWRYAVDNMWTGAGVADLLPEYRAIADSLPPSPSHCMWMNWSPGDAERPEMAFSVEDDIYLGLYGVWHDAADDDRHGRWAVDRMREMEGLATGIQLADENLAQRPGRFLSDPNRRRLEEVRDHYDPERRIHSYGEAPGGEVGPST